MADLQCARTDLAVFAKVIGQPLTRWQARALRLEHRTTVIVAPRQSGKSRSLAVLALHRAFGQPRSRALVVSAGEEASRRLLAEVRHMATGSPLLRGSVVDEQAQLVTLTNGSEIRSVPASERQIRGWTVDLLLVDEAALVADDLLLGAALPTTAARPDARVVLASSPLTAAGAFYDHAMRGEGGGEHVRTFRWALTDARWISRTVIEAARASMTEARFRCEYEGEFASGADNLFSRDTLDRATLDVVVSGWERLAGPVRVLAGMDWGATTDRSAITAVARLAVPGEPLFAVVAAHAWRAGAPLDGPGGVVGEVADSRALFDTLTLETNGLGLPVAQALERRMRDRVATGGGGRGARWPSPPSPWATREIWQRFREQVERCERLGMFATDVRLVHTTGDMKAAVYSELRLLLDRGRLVLPASAEALRRELLLLRVDLLPSGGERIEASTGHDDLADALMLAAGPARAQDGRWGTRLGELCERSDLPACPPVDEAAVVESGTGRRLPREPHLLSVDGEQTTAPPPSPPPPPEPERRGDFLIHRNTPSTRRAI